MMITTRRGVTIQALLRRAEQVFPGKGIAYVPALLRPIVPDKLCCAGPSTTFTLEHRGQCFHLQKYGMQY